ncbi:MAG: MoxR family ATPase [Candidatus Hermodarchaeota archaeon]|nr:MoxR family ATPase [Candidatus Hermodarchaeota archaeon]
MVLSKDIKTIQREYKIIGRQDLITQCLASDKADKHMLIEGPVGVGKTTIASAITNFLGRSFFRVDGDERYTSAKLVGWFDPPVVLKNGYTRDTFVPGPLVETMETGGVLFINEINRMPEATQNTLLPVMDEGTLHVPKLGTIKAKNGFRIIATQNPEASVGVTPLGEALRDRYVWLYLDYHTEAEEKEIVHINTGVEDKEIVELAVAITRATRDYTDIRRGASVRGAIDITSLYTQLPGEGYDVWEQAAIMSLVPKIELHDDAQKSAIEVIKTLVKAVLANF